MDYFLAPGVALNMEGGMNFRRFEGANSKNIAFVIGLDAFIIPDGDKGDGSTLGQFRKGSLIIGGSNVTISRSLDDLSWGLNIQPRIGYFASNRLVLGAELGYTFNQFLGLGFGNFSDRDFRFSPFLRYYFDYPKRFNPFVAVETTFLSESTDFNGQDSFNNRNTPKLSLGGDYFLSPNIAFEGLLDLGFNPGLENLFVEFRIGMQYFIH
ncbi:MAG: outer membrane beta-barrel protein [Bacteroidota bacterium]